MKKLSAILICTLTASVADAAHPVYGSYSEYNNLNAVYQTYPKYNNTRDTSAPKSPQFYIGTKGGFNFNIGSIFADVDDGLSFTQTGGTFGGFIGLDFTKSKFRIELEISNIPKTALKWDFAWKDNLHAEMGTTNYIINFVRYFELNDRRSLNLTLTGGIGGANISFADVDRMDSMYLKTSNLAIAANMGVGLDIKITDSFWITPEIRDTMVIGTTDISMCVSSVCAGVEDAIMWSNNFQFLLGARYNF